MIIKIDNKSGFSKFGIPNGESRLLPTNNVTNFQMTSSGRMDAIVFISADANPLGTSASSSIPGYADNQALVQVFASGEDILKGYPIATNRV